MSNSYTQETLQLSPHRAERPSFSLVASGPARRMTATVADASIIYFLREGMADEAGLHHADAGAVIEVYGFQAIQEFCAIAPDGNAALTLEFFR